jgi:copper homeostasis protein
MLSNINRLLEVCCGGIDEVIQCQQAGIKRIELNCGLMLGGLTPSIGLMRQARAVFSGQIIAMIRPRGGGFEYSAQELLVCFDDAVAMLANGADGIAFGCLKGHQLDLEVMDKMRQLTVDKVFVCHRAFDLVDNQFQSLDELINLKVDRVLTSGQESSVLLGFNRLNELVEYSADRIEILAGAGVNLDSYQTLKHMCRVNQWHASLRGCQYDYNTNNGVSFAACQPNEYEGLDQKKLMGLLMVMEEDMV